MNNHFAPEASSTPTLHPEISADERKVLIANLFLYRRQKDMSCSWHIPLGIPMNSIALHTYLGMQAFVAFAVRMGFSNEAIGLGLLMFLNHDLDELITVDKNIYSSPFLKVDCDGAMAAIQKGHPFASMNLEIHQDYELGKKKRHEDELINLVATLLKDIDGLERPLEQLEKVGRGSYPERRWRRPEVQAENTYTAENYKHDMVRNVHNHIIGKDLAIFEPPDPNDTIMNNINHHFAQSIFKLRREQFQSPVKGFLRPDFHDSGHNKALQKYFQMQTYLVLGQLSGLSRQDIANGLLKLMLQNSPILQQEFPSILPTRDALIEDACLLSEVLDHIEFDAILPREDPANKPARAKARNAYSTPVARWLHDAIVVYGLDAFDDAFLRLPNTKTSGTHGKYP